MVLHVGQSVNEISESRNKVKSHPKHFQIVIAIIKSQLDETKIIT